MTSPLAPFRRDLATRAAQTLGLDADVAATLERQIRIPDADRGDLALGCFELARHAKKSPADVARQVSLALQGEEGWGHVEAAGPYVNVTLGQGKLAEAVVEVARSSRYGTGDEGAGKAVVIDFSSPNIAKPLAFHHVRSTVIGAAIGRLHRARGWKVAGINYLGDWGKQFGLLATGFQRYGDPALRADAKHLVEVYVKANREADVGRVKARIEAPTEAKTLIGLLEKTRIEAASSADAKAKKKATRSVKSLEKKIRSQRGLSGDADPLADVSDWLAALDADRAVAETELESVQARDQEARLFFKRLEDGEASARAEWQEFRDTSIAEFERVYARMGIEFESIEGESFYTDVLEQIVERVTATPGTKISDGALIVDMEYKDEPPVLLKTRDGTTLYVTRDIAAAIDRFERFGFERNLYVVAGDQSLHFSQLFRTLAAMGFDWADRCKHIEFGRVHGMSTRRGNVVFLDEVLDEAVAKAREVCEQSERIDRTRLDETIESIGVGSVIFGDLKNLRGTDYTFRWEDVVKLDGQTGPYVQYTHARTCSILAKGGGVPETANVARLVGDEERTVMMQLARFPDCVAEACDSFEPSLVTRNLLDIAAATSSYLTAGKKDRGKRILLEGDDELRDARLWLVDAIRQTLASGLAILGVKAPDAM